MLKTKEADTLEENCTCGECISLCWRNPGWFGTIEELQGAAQIKGLTLEEFAQEYLIREWWAGDEDDVEIPAPRRNFSKRNRAEPGREWREEYYKNGKGFVRASWGHNLITGYACVFLVEDRCSIHTSKPMECRISFGCQFPVDKTRQTNILSYWKKHQRFVGSLVIQLD